MKPIEEAQARAYIVQMLVGMIVVLLVLLGVAIVNLLLT